jgi:hypothetical protein
MHLTDIPPVCCSVCFNQDPQAIHIDMDAAYDGPVLDASGTRHSVDDIVMCEKCVRAAVNLLPDSREKDEQIAQLLAQYDQLLEYVARVTKGLGQVQSALDLHLEPLKARMPARRPAGPKIKV